MAFTNFNPRDLNAFLIGNSQTSAMLGPGTYQPKSDFADTVKRAHSRKPPAFLDGIPDASETVALGSNYLDMKYTPGPGKYNVDKPFSQFSTEILKD